LHKPISRPTYPELIFVTKFAGRFLAKMLREARNFHIGRWNDQSPEITVFNKFIAEGADLNSANAIA